MSTHKGSCHCGNVKLFTELEPILTVQCNCLSCRKVTGSIALGAWYPEDDITYTHEQAFVTYEYIGGSGHNMYPFFCSNCYSRVGIRIEIFPGFIGVPVGVFDDAENISPVLEVFTRSKLPFISDHGSIKERFEGAAVKDRIAALMKALEDR